MEEFTQYDAENALRFLFSSTVEWQVDLKPVKSTTYVKI